MVKGKKNNCPTLAKSNEAQLPPEITFFEENLK